jgi:rhodanese-related sulfurtransferase
MIRLLLVLAFCVLVTGSQVTASHAAEPRTRVRVEHSKDSLAKIHGLVEEDKAVLVDVRTNEEWVKGHVAGAVHVPSDSLRKHSYDAAKIAKLLPKDKPLYLYCQIGMRSKQAAVLLIREGYDARALKQGTEEIVESGAGFEMEAGEKAVAAE